VSAGDLGLDLYAVNLATTGTPTSRAAICCSAWRPQIRPVGRLGRLLPMSHLVDEQVAGW
jgi:hypothetical protein